MKLFYLLFVFLFCILLTLPGFAAERPNIVLFYIDDLDFDEIGVYDHVAFPCYTGASELGLFTENMNPWLAYFESPKIHTPQIDQLVAEGVRFNRFYITSSVCTPSRYSLLTGRYASRSPIFCETYPPGTQANLMWNTHLGLDEDNLAKTLQKNGYTTGLVGKWHNTDWDSPYAGRVHGVAPDADPRDPVVAKKIRDAYNIGVEHIRQHHGFDFVERVYLQNKEALGLPKVLAVHNLEWIVEGALEFIEANQDDPFFLYFASPAPHGWIGSGDIKNTDPCATPAGMLEAPPRGMPPRDDTLRRAKAAGVTGRRMEATWIDDAIGTVLRKLDTCGLRENTIVLFISDHQNRGKYTNYEGNRVPALIRWPAALKGGVESDALCANIDVTPMLLEACGIPSADTGRIDGRSFLPVLTGSGNTPLRDALLLEVAYSKAVVTPDWKYIALRYPPAIQQQVDAAPGTYTWDGTQGIYKKATQWDKQGDVYTPYGGHKDFPGYFDPDQLYNLQDDPYEQKNLAGSPEHQTTLVRLQALLKEQLKDLPHTFGGFKTR